MDNHQPGLFGKTLQEPYLPTKVQTLGKSSTKWMKQGRVSRSGESWMRNTSESPNGVDECSSSLASILQEPATVDAKYRLSAKAAEGILRRANRRGKTLPEKLQQALETVALKNGADNQQL